MQRGGLRPASSSSTRRGPPRRRCGCARAGTAAGFLDLFDGPAAKAGGTTSSRGNFLDSVCDRVSESLMYFALFYYSIHRRGSLRLAYLVVVAYMAAQLTSYARAKAE